MTFLNFFKPKPPVVEPGRDRLKSWQILSLRAELQVLLYKAFNAGKLPKPEYHAGEKQIASMPVQELKNDIAYYKRLLETA